MTEEQKKRAEQKKRDDPPGSDDPASSSDFSFISILLEETNMHVVFPKLKDIYAKPSQIVSSAERDIQRHHTHC